MKGSEKFDINAVALQKAEPKYLQQMKELWAVCFPEDGASGFVDFFFERCYDSQTAYVAVKDGKVLAMAYGPLLSYKLCGKIFQVPYIQGVATDPLFRRQGIANALLAKMLEDFHLQGIPFGILKPFSVDFYHKSGWRVFARLAAVDIKKFLPRIRENQNMADLKDTAVVDIDEKDYLNFLTDFAAVFSYYQENSHNSYPLRSNEDWQLLLADHFNDGGRAAAVLTDGKMLGYMLYMAEHDQIFVRETAYINTNVRDRLWRLFAQGTDNNQTEKQAEPKIICHLPYNQKLTADFAEIPFAMVRIINVETLLSAFDLGLLPQEKAYFRLHDDVIEQNNGSYQLFSRNGISCCHRLAEADGLPKLCPEINVDLLTGLLSRCYNFNNSKNGLAGCNYFNEYFR